MPKSWPNPPEMKIDVNKTYTATIETTAGTMTAELYPKDAPGHVNSFTLTLTHPGRWIGRCAQLCGLYHYGMDFYVQAVSPAAFDRFLRSHGGTETS